MWSRDIVLRLEGYIQYVKPPIYASELFEHINAAIGLGQIRQYDGGWDRCRFFQSSCVTIYRHPTGDVGYAFCGPADKYDRELGMRIAKGRALKRVRERERREQGGSDGAEDFNYRSNDRGVSFRDVDIDARRGVNGE